MQLMNNHKLFFGKQSNYIIELEYQKYMWNQYASIKDV